MPIGDLNLAFGAVKNRLAEGDRKADCGIENLAVVGVVIDISSKVVAPQLKMTGIDFTQASFIIIPERRMNG